MKYHIKIKNTSYGLIRFLISLGLIFAFTVPLLMPKLCADIFPPNLDQIKMAEHKTKGPDYFAFGDVRGEIEPCGCDPLTDLGGFKRIAKLARDNPKVAIFSLGNLYPVNPNPLKDELIGASLSSIKVTAALLNEIELNMLKTKRPLDFSRAHYVLSNVTPSPLKNVRSSIETPSFSVYGFVTPSPNLSNAGFALASYLKVKERWATELKNNKKYKILLFAGSDADLKTIEKDKIFDEIISSNPKPLKATPDHEEKKKPGLLLRQDGVYMVPSFGQGLLLGGSLRSKYGAKKPTSIFSDRKPMKEKDEKLDFSFGSDQIFLWLTKDFEDSGSLAQIFKIYNERVANAYKSLAKQRTAELVDTKFAGAKACQSCHPEAFMIWENSAHSHAFATLKGKVKHQDPECISCHVLGLKEKGGFVNETVTPHFANVQCETCHGPRKEHVSNPSANPGTLKSAKEVCASCHHQPHSSNFIFETYWPKIRH